MHDPFTWSFPMGRLFGITIRVHFLFPFVALCMILYAIYYKPYPEYEPPKGLWIDVTILMAILFVVVLLHEFGHCFAARWVQGDAQEVLLWPLGGLANVEVPHRPRAHFITAAGGPAVNLVLALLCGLLLAFAADKANAFQPIWNPLPDGFPARDGKTGLVTLSTWRAGDVPLSPYSWSVWLARICWVNYFLFLLNVVLVGFPLDGGRLLQAALWPSLGYRQATLTAVFAGFIVFVVVAGFSFVMNQTMALGLAIFILVSCHRQWVVLETGGEEGVFGYDFSQGYTSLERDQPTTPPPPARRVSWWRRWLQRRAAKRMQREQEQREAEERRLDELLEKVHREGQGALTDEERRFMKRVSDRYKHRR
jgi:Zn-dependent protease